MKKIFNKTIVMMCITSVVLVTGCGNGEKYGVKETSNLENSVSSGFEEDNITENTTFVVDKPQSDRIYEKGDVFEIEGCTFTIDDIVFDVNKQNVCAILLTVVNNGDKKFSFANADFYADNFECEEAYMSEYDERVKGYVTAALKSVDVGRGIKVYYDAKYPEDCTSLEAEIMRTYGGDVLYKVKLK